MSALETPRDGAGAVDWNRGWKLWTDMVRFYPSGVHRRRLVGEWLAPHRPRTILDAGCGTGHTLAALHARFPNAVLTGIDSSDETVAHLRARLPWGRFETVQLAEAPLAERFDAVVCTEVLEHIRDDEAALRNLVAMTGRHLMLTVPAGPLLPLEAGFGHLRHYELKPLCARVEALGLRVVRAEAWGFPFMTLFKRAANLRPTATMDAFGSGDWSLPKKALGAVLTGVFYLNLPVAGPQILLLAER